MENRASDFHDVKDILTFYVKNKQLCKVNAKSIAHLWYLYMGMKEKQDHNKFIKVKNSVCANSAGNLNCL